MKNIANVALRCTLILGVAFLCRPTTLNETPTDVSSTIYGGACTAIKTKSCGGTTGCTKTTIIDLEGVDCVKMSTYVAATCGLPGETCETTQRLIPVACSCSDGG